MWHRDTKRANAVGKMVPIGLLNAGVVTKKKTLYLQRCSKAKHSEMRCASTHRPPGLSSFLSIFLNAIINKVVFLIFFLSYLLLVYKNGTECNPVFQKSLLVFQFYNINSKLFGAAQDPVWSVFNQFLHCSLYSLHSIHIGPCMHSWTHTTHSLL